MMNAWRNSVPALVAVTAALSACGTGTVPSRPPATEQPTQENPAAGDALETPGPWAPSRSIRLDRFALETALGVALVGPVGDELESSTRWRLAGGSTELRLDLRTGFNGAEAEVQCRALAGAGGVESLSLGTPVWTAANDVYLTRERSCIRVSVTRSGRADPAGAVAVAGALVRADQIVRRGAPAVVAP